MADDYTIVVKVTAESQTTAFRFVERALESHLARLIASPVEGVHVSTPDGLHSTGLVVPLELPHD